MTKKTTTTAKISGATTAKATASAVKTNTPNTERSLQGASAKPRIDSATRDRMIREQAYYNAQQRGFIGDDTMQDWLAAERLINEKFT